MFWHGAGCAVSAQRKTSAQPVVGWPELRDEQPGPGTQWGLGKCKFPLGSAYRGWRGTKGSSLNPQIPRSYSFPFLALKMVVSVPALIPVEKKVRKGSGREKRDQVSHPPWALLLPGFPGSAAADSVIVWLSLKLPERGELRCLSVSSGCLGGTGAGNWPRARCCLGQGRAGDWSTEDTKALSGRDPGELCSSGRAPRGGEVARAGAHSKGGDGSQPA